MVVDESHERCRCGQPAVFEATSRRVGGLRKERRGGQVVVVQPYVVFYLCAACTRAAVVSQDPPREVRALSHHAALLKSEARDRARTTAAETLRLGDWGKR